MKPPLKELRARVIRLDSMLKFTLQQKYNTQTSVIIAKAWKEIMEHIASLPRIKKATHAKEVTVAEGC